MVEGLDDFLEGNEPVAAAPAPAEPAPAETPPADPVAADPAPSGPARGPDGKFISKGETDASPASKEEFDGKATIGERRRRQEAEARIAELEAQLQQLSNPPQPAPDFYENQPAWESHFGTQVVSQAVQQASLNAKLDMSEMMVRQSNADFEDMKALFMDLAKDNPSLAQQCLTDPHPWNRAYQIAKNHEKMQTLGATNVAELEAKLREEIKAQLEAEAKAVPQVELPTSLATAQPGQGPATAQPVGFESIGQILGR